MQQHDAILAANERATGLHATIKERLAPHLIPSHNASQTQRVLLLHVNFQHCG